MKKKSSNYFDLSGRIAVITGGAGLLGRKHAEAIAEQGGTPVLADLNKDIAATAAKEIEDKIGTNCASIQVDITSKESVIEMKESLLEKFGNIHILINNAANNPRMEAQDDTPWSRMENFPLDLWNKDICVGLTGAFLCSQIIGQHFAEKEEGVILNIASDLGVIAPDQRIYREEGLPENQQQVKPVTYSVVKHGLIGLTKYLSTYWADKNVRVNSISPGGVYNNQPSEFVEKLSQLIPMGRMANQDEYKAAILFLCSDASSYMTGHNLVIDGGRTVW